MPAHDEDHWALVFSDTYTVLLERAPEAPTLEEMTTVSLDSTQTASKPSRPVWAVVMAAAAVVVLVGGAAWLSGLTESNASLATTPPSLPVSPSNWSRVPNDEAVFGGEGEQVMSSVTAGGPGLVAVGSDGSAAAVWTSPDGITWSRVPHDETIFGGVGDRGMWREGDGGMLSVTAGGPGLVAVGWEEYGAAVWTSVDGITWSRVPHNEAIFGEAEMRSVTGGGPGLVAVGLDGSENDAAVWTSPNGTTWSRVPHNEAIFGEAGMSSVTGGGPGLVAVGSAEDGVAAVWTSVDGITWSRVPHDNAVFGRGGVMNSVTAGVFGLIAVGSDESDADKDAAVWTSPDGITWTRVPQEEVLGGPSFQAMSSVTVGGSGLIAVGLDGSGADQDAAVWTSPDGVTWSRVSIDEAVFGGVGRQAMASVTAGDFGLVAVGSDWSGNPIVRSTRLSFQDAAVWID